MKSVHNSENQLYTYQANKSALEFLPIVILYTSLEKPAMHFNI